MNLFRRTITFLLILSLLGADVAPAVAAAGVGSVAVPEKSDEVIPPFPEDASEKLVDWSGVDWDRTVVLPEDERAYFARLEELLARRDMSSVASLKKQEETMSSDRILDAYRVPQNVQAQVRAYRIESEKLKGKERAARKVVLRDSIKRLLEDTGRMPSMVVPDKGSEKKETKPDQQAVSPADLEKFAPIDLGAKPSPTDPVDVVSETTSQGADVTIQDIREIPAAKNSLQNVTLEALRGRHLEKPARPTSMLLFDQHSSVTNISEVLWGLVGVVPARAGSSFIEPYDGIEKKPFDFGLSYLAAQQQSDGGFNTPDRFLTSAQIALLLSEARRTDNDQYQSIISFLKTVPVATLRDRAMKARILFSLQDQSYTALLDEIITVQRSDGGFGLTAYHPSDVLTTLEVTWALWGTQHYKKDGGSSLAKALLFVSRAIDKDGAVRYTADGPPSPYLVAKVLQYFVCFSTFRISAVTGEGEQIDISIKDKINAMLSYLKTGIDPVTGALGGSREFSDLAHVLHAFQLYRFEQGLQTKIRERLLANQRSNGSFDDSVAATLAALHTLAEPDFEITTITQVPGPIMQVGSKTFGEKLTVGYNGKFDVVVKNVGVARGTPKAISSFVDSVLFDANGPVVVPRPLWPGESMVIGYTMPIPLAFAGESKFEFFVDAEELEHRSDNNWKAETFTVEDLEGRPSLPRYFVTQKWQIGHDDNPDVPANAIPKGTVVPVFMVNYRKKADPKRRNIVVLHRPKGVTEVGRDSDGNPIPWYQTHIPDKYSGFFLGNFTQPYLPEDAEFEVTVGVVDLNGKVHIPKEGIIIKLTSDEKKYLGTVSGTLTLGSEPAPNVNVRGNGIDQKTDEKGNFSVMLPNGTGGVWGDRMTAPWLDELVTVFPIPNGGEEKNIRVFTRMKKDGTPPVLEKPFVMPQFPESEIKSDRVVTLVARASDAVYVKHATFWYWDPSKKNWSLVISKDAPFNRDGFSIDIMHKWYVPPSMIGQGYKIKAVVSDYSGNTSGIVESDTFEIKDGVAAKDVTPPTIGSLELRFMRDNKVKNQQEVTLIASATDDSQVVSGEFSYLEPAKNEWVAIGTTTGQYGTQWMTWTIPKELLGQGYKLKAVVTDDSGNNSEAKEFGPFEIVDGSAPWGVVTVDGLKDNTWILGEKKTIQWDIKGANPVKFVDSVKLYFGGPDYSIDYLKGNLGAVAKGSLEYQMRLSAHLEGPAKIVVYACDVNISCAQIESAPFTIVDPSQPRQYPWGTEQKFDLTRTKFPLSRALQQAFQNADGSREFIYLEYDQKDVDNYRRIMYRKLDGGVWQDAIPLVEYRYASNEQPRSFSEIQAVKGPRGEIHVTFVQTIGDGLAALDTNEVFYLRFENGSVQDRRQLSNDDTMSSQGRIGVDNAGFAVVAWVEGYSFVRGGGVNKIKVRSNIGGDWSGETIISGQTYAWGPAVAMDGSVPVVAYNDNGDHVIQRADGGVSSWSSAVPITPRAIPKSQLAQVAESTDVFSRFVEDDPSDATRYLWKSSIRTRADLEKTLSGVASKDTILAVWSDNQYARNAYELNLFSSRAGTYDLFYRRGNPSKGWRYSLHTLRVQPDFAAKDPGVQREHELADVENSTDVRSYRMLRDRDGIYHIFYIKQFPASQQLITHPYHMLFDGQEQWFLASAASPLRYVSDVVTSASEVNGKVTYYFADGGYVNTADYSTIKQYRLKPIGPANNSTLTSSEARLSWEISGGDVDSYTILAGTNPDALAPVAERVAGVSTAISGLAGDATYFWQVLGKKGDATIPSAVWLFTTPPAASEIEIEDDAGALDLSKPLVFPNITVGSSSEKTLLIRNLGNAALDLSGNGGAKIVGDNAQDFTITKQPDATIASGAATTITVAAKPLSSGAKKAELVFSTNDSDEQEIRITLTSSASAPILSLTVDGTNVAVGGTRGLGDILTGAVLDIPVTIKNAGDANLDLLKPRSGIADGELDGTGSELSLIQFSGTGSGYARVVSDPVTPILPGGESKFIVRFQPKKSGDAPFSFSFTHNDKKIVNPASVNFLARVIEPNIVLAADGRELTGPRESIGRLSLDDVRAGETRSVVIQILNKGNAQLQFTPSVVGTGDEQVISFEEDISKPIPQIFPRPSWTYILTVAPKNGGAKSFGIRVASNDPDQSETGIDITYNSTNPEIRVLSDSKEIQNNATISLGDVTVGTRKMLTFDIENAGDTDLNLTDTPPIFVSGQDASDCTATVPEKTVLKKGEKTSFTVSYAPLQSKASAACTLTMKNTDADEGVFTINLAATARDPELDVFYDDAAVPSGGSVILGETGVGVPLERTFTMKNNGDEQVRFEGAAPFVTLEGSGANAFTVTSTIKDGKLDPGKTATVTVRFSGADRGEKTATIVLASNDRDEGRYVITVTAGSHDPALRVWRDTTLIDADARQSFGDTEVSASSTVEYMVTNEGDKDLVFSGDAPYAILSGNDTADFEVRSTLPARLKKGESATVAISFAPRTQGAKTAVLTITSNDRVTPAFAINLSGTGTVSSAQFAIGNSVLENGGTITGQEVFVGATSTITVLVKNAGKAQLLISGPPRVALSGDDADEFAIASEPETPLSTGGETSFAVTLQPKTFGKKTARLSLRTNDPNSASVTFNLTFEAIPVGSGTGLTAEYFGDTKLQSLVTRKRDDKVDFDWKDASPSADLYKNDFSVRWSGELEPQYTGRYELISRADDGIKVFVDGKMVLDDWNEHTVRENRANVDMIQGKHVPITVEYFEGTGDASVHLLWKTPKGIEEVIHQAQLYPTDKPDLIPEPAGNGKGLTAEYFADLDMKLLALRRTDRTLNFRWDFGAPDEILPSSGFSARWKGHVTPRYSGEYTFITKSDDGVRLWIEGKKIIDDWNKRPANKAETRSATIDLEKGKAVDLTLEYFDDTGYATARLYWKTPTGIEEIIPQAQLQPTDAPDVIPSPLGTGTGLSGEYFNDTEFKAMVLRRTDSRVQFTWKYDAPHPDLPQSGFSVRWTGFIEPRYTGTYTFTTKSDEGVRLRVNETSVIDTWGTKEQNKTLVNTGKIALEQGKKYPIELSYMDDGGYATMRLLWETPYGVSEVVPASQLYVSGSADVIPMQGGTGTGLKGEYFKDTELKESVLTRTDKTVNFRWEFGSPDAKISADRYSARWTGKLEPRYTGKYTFTTKTDDGIRLWVNGEKIIDDWSARPLKTNVGTIDLVAGQKVDITMEYFEDTGYATARLYWTTPYGQQDFIPQSQMYPQ